MNGLGVACSQEAKKVMIAADLRYDCEYDLQEPRNRTNILEKPIDKAVCSAFTISRLYVPSVLSPLGEPLS